jgi:predicted ATP-dependent serine protease
MKLPKLKISSYVRIGGIIPKNEVTVVVGLPSTGKTHTTIKFLNEHKITPVVFNLDESVHDITLQCHSVEGKYITDFYNGRFSDLKDLVVIIDTYQLMTDELTNDPDSTEFKKEVSKKLREIAHTEECTIIVIGHTEDFASKDGIFEANKYLIRDCAEHIIMTAKSTNKMTNNTISYHTTIKKGRGIGGTIIIENWMR